MTQKKVPPMFADTDRTKAERHRGRVLCHEGYHLADGYGHRTLSRCMP